MLLKAVTKKPDGGPVLKVAKAHPPKSVDVIVPSSLGLMWSDKDYHDLYFLHLVK